MFENAGAITAKIFHTPKYLFIELVLLVAVVALTAMVVLTILSPWVWVPGMVVLFAVNYGFRRHVDRHLNGTL